MFLKGVFFLKKDFLSELGIEDSKANKIIEIYNESLKGFIPKSRFDEVNEAKKQLDKQITEYNKQLETLKASNEDIETFKKTIAELQEKNKAERTTFEEKMKRIQLDRAVETELLKAKAKNTTAVKALLSKFLEDPEFDGESVKGLDKEIAKLAESEETGFLFNKVDAEKPRFQGVLPTERKDGTPTNMQKSFSLADAITNHFKSKFQS